MKHEKIVCPPVDAYVEWRMIFTGDDEAIYAVSTAKTPGGMFVVYHASTVIIVV